MQKIILNHLKHTIISDNAFCHQRVTCLIWIELTIFVDSILTLLSSRRTFLTTLASQWTRICMSCIVLESKRIGYLTLIHTLIAENVSFCKVNLLSWLNSLFSDWKKTSTCPVEKIAGHPVNQSLSRPSVHGPFQFNNYIECTAAGWGFKNLRPDRMTILWLQVKRFPWNKIFLSTTGHMILTQTTLM